MKKKIISECCNAEVEKVGGMNVVDKEENRTEVGVTYACKKCHHLCRIKDKKPTNTMEEKLKTFELEKLSIELCQQASPSLIETRMVSGWQD